VRSLLALDAVGNLGTVIVMHHTDCGMSHTDEAGFRAKTAVRHPEVLKSEPGMVFGAIEE
jgi:carbonic anhydrase